MHRRQAVDGLDFGGEGVPDGVCCFEDLINIRKNRISQTSDYDHVWNLRPTLNLLQYLTCMRTENISASLPSKCMGRLSCICHNTIRPCSISLSDCQKKTKIRVNATRKDSKGQSSPSQIPGTSATLRTADRNSYCAPICRYVTILASSANDY